MTTIFTQVYEIADMVQAISRVRITKTITRGNTKVLAY